MPKACLTDRYDDRIRDAVKRWLPVAYRAHGWQVLKAQYCQESLLNPAAVSHVGAQGIAQFMPGTWREQVRLMGLGSASPHEADVAIVAGANYMMRMRKGWTAPRPEHDKHSLATAGYNCGQGNLYKAQRLAGGAVSYEAIIAQLPRVTGRHARETTTYVRRIWRYHALMVAL